VTLPARIAIVDLETTGGNPVKDRITEIAVIRVEDGVITQRWESLVQPGVSIPPTIQAFTGITNQMVADAPTFADLADTVRALLDGCVFLAHNARFDYGFIKNAYALQGERFDAPVLCTVKLSRALYPAFHRHGLDALIERYGFTCEARHRAMGDTDVLWQFLQQVRDEFADEVIAPAVAKAMKAPARPADLPEGAIDGIPDTPGVYLFFGDNTLPLYIGKSISLRARVMDHFSASNRNGKEADLARQVKRVEWIETAGELSALLLESQLVKERRPLANRQLRSNDDYFGYRYVPGRRRPPILERVELNGTDPGQWTDIHGLFRNRREADKILRELALAYQLCPRRLGLEPGGSGACMAHQLKRCAGVCAGRESIEAHDERLLGALASSGLKPWPWEGPVIYTEQASHTGIVTHHLLQHWCLLGSVDDASLPDLLAAPPAPAFDLDLYRILVRWFENPARRSAVRPAGI